tara:strand:+ start:2411 stop:2608 length:198 start_codon:yes stop_codon:yes gene_type:complete
MSDNTNTQLPMPPEQQAQFEEDIQKILSNFGFPADFRRKFFLDLKKYSAAAQQKPKEKSGSNDHD